MTTDYDALFFDADNTLFDYSRGETAAFHSTIRQFELPGDEEQIFRVFQSHNRNVWHELEQGEITADALKAERFRRLLSALGRQDLDPIELGVWYLDRLSEQTWLLDGVEDMLKAVAEVYPLALITNGLSTVQRRRFAASPITRFFSSIVVSEEVGVAKPDPAIFENALRELSVDAGKVLMTGDSTTSDMAAAGNAGMDFCWYNPRGEAAPEGQTVSYTIEKLEELCDILELPMHYRSKE